MSRSAIVRKLRSPALTPVQITRPFQREAPANLGFVLAIPEDASVVAPGDGVVSAIWRTRPGWNYTLVANRNSLCVCLDHGEGIKTYVHGLKNLSAVQGSVTRGDVLGPSTGEVFFAIEIDRTLINPAQANSFFVPRDGQIFFEQPNFIAQAPTVVRNFISDVRVALESTLNYFIRPGGGLILFNVAFNGNGNKVGLAATGVSDTDYWNVYDPVDFFITGYTCGYGLGAQARYFNLPMLVPLRTHLNAPSKVFLERVVPLTSFAGAGASWDEMMAAWVGGYSGPTPYVNAFNIRGLPRGSCVLYLYAEQGTSPLASTFQVTVDGDTQTESTNPTGTPAFVENDNYVVFDLALGARSVVEIVANGYLSGLQIIECGGGAYVPPVPPVPVSSYAIEGTVTDGGVGFSAGLEFTSFGTVFSAASGSYNQGVVAGYSGTVIPHYSGGTFSPAQRVYAAVGANYTGQDYAFYATTPPAPPGPTSYVIEGTITTSGSIGVSCDISLNTRVITSAASGSYSYRVASGYSGTTQPTFITSPGSYSYANVTSDQTDQNFDAPAPVLAYNSLDWTWALGNPQYWELQIKDPDFGMHDLLAGSERSHSVTEYDFWWRIVGRNASLAYNTPFSNEVYSTPPVPPAPSTVLIMPLNAASGLTLLSVGFAGSNQFVTLDGLGGAYTSTDALNWTATGTTASFPSCLAYGDGLYVAGGVGGEIETSPDTLNWTVRGSPTAETFRTMIYADNRFVGGAHNGAVVTSADGTTWSLTTTGGAENVVGLAYGNGTYVAAAVASIYTSADGTVWAAAPAPSASIVAVTYSQDFARFYAGGNGILLESADTVAWTDITSALNVEIVGLAAGNGTVVAAAYQGTVYSTSDGTNWFKDSVADPAMGATGYLDRVVFCGTSVFLAGETTPPT